MKDTKMINQGQQSQYSLRNFNVLLVEDYDFIKGIVVAMLRVFGVADVITCSNAEEAIDILTINMTQVRHGTAKPIDIVLTDWMMPEGSGYDLVKWIRNHRSDTIRFMPVIMLSTFASAKAVIEARDSGVNEILVKPVSAEKVATRILSIIDHPRPYVKAASFFGPDRRRRDKEWKEPERRVTDISQIAQHNEAA
jgi:DNA-binding response OmpR family regulator